MLFNVLLFMIIYYSVFCLDAFWIRWPECDFFSDLDVVKYLPMKLKMGGVRGGWG